MRQEFVRITRPRTTVNLSYSRDLLVIGLGAKNCLGMRSNFSISLLCLDTCMLLCCQAPVEATCLHLCLALYLWQVCCRMLTPEAASAIR